LPLNFILKEAKTSLARKAREGILYCNYSVKIKTFFLVNNSFRALTVLVADPKLVNLSQGKMHGFRLW